MISHHDVVVIGAGFSGLYAAHKFGNDLGLKVKGFERAGGVGGTWWWNRYPGARCDFESVHYSYSFSSELQREWEWTERFAGQPEILSYLEWVATKLNVLGLFQFETSVTAMTWDETSAYWTVTTSDGKTCTASFIISCVGGLSQPKEVEFKGSNAFKGELYWTSSWPHEKVEFSGKRIAVIGTGSSGIQLIQEVAKEAGSLTVFQRTPNFAVPLGNAPVEPELRRWYAENHEEVRGDSRNRLIGAPYDRATVPATAVDSFERKRVYDKYWKQGGFPFVVSTFSDILFNKESNDTIADYVRSQIRERVNDPVKAELLCPTDHAYGTKRPPFETSYYEVYNQSNVNLVDVKKSPIEAVTANGIQTSDAMYEFDMILMATGFDAFTGAHLAIPTVGRGGLTLQDAWAEGPKNYVGLCMSQFPNFFTVMGPLSASAQYNSPLLIEDNIDFAAAAILEARSRGARVIAPTIEAESKWSQLVSDVLHMSLFAGATNSWHMGDNIKGKPRAAYTFPVGAPLYRAICNQVQVNGFAGFAIDDNQTPVPPLIRLDAGAALVTAGMMNQGMPQMEDCSPEMLREMVDRLQGMQRPGPQVKIQDLPEHHVRLYCPYESADLPVVIFLHGGGFVAGSIDSVDPTCRRLCSELEALVVSVDYRLAPEHPYPAATDDVFAALKWVVQSIAQYGGDPKRVVIMGESAGANLAAVTALRARDADIPILAQILISPAFDPDANTESLQEFQHGPFLTAKAGRKFWSMYLGQANAEPYIAPPKSASLAGLAPALVITMELDPTRDESEAYAVALVNAGVFVRKERIEGLFHGVMMMSALVPRTDVIFELASNFFEEQVTRH